MENSLLASELRRTPIVRAVQEVSPSVVSIQGKKIIPDTKIKVAGATRLVNGMGTGTVIDSRGYILTNHHVVDGVGRINVTLSDGRLYVAQVIAVDPATDLAVIKIRAPRPLPVVRIGQSFDLYPGETVIAIGNAYGYEHTVTKGIISALHRDVQVSDTQSYLNLIQTDASINPGNSGGPLLNIDGDMIGVNVAVRAGAQGIGFAIPVNEAMKVAARMMSIEKIDNKWHGVVSVSQSGTESHVKVHTVKNMSPADACGIKRGDEVVRVGGRKVNRPLDIELAMLGKRVGTKVPIEVLRNGVVQTLELSVASRRTSVRRTKPVSSPRVVNNKRVWDTFGLELVKEAGHKVTKLDSNYRGGMRVTRVRANSPASKQGIKAGDILLGMHRWETTSQQDLDYIVSQSRAGRVRDLKFYILRDGGTLYGNLQVATKVSGTPRNRK